MNLPSQKEVEQLWDEYHVPEQIRRHCRKVALVGVFLARKLNEKGIKVDERLVEKAGLLHDLTRTSNFTKFEVREGCSKEDVEFWKSLHKKYGSMCHSESAGEILKQKYPELAEVVRSHGFEFKAKCTKSWPWEIKIINYADFRVLHDRIVSAAERLKDSETRHGDFHESVSRKLGINSCRMVKEVTSSLENEIFGIIGIRPEDIKEGMEVQ